MTASFRLPHDDLPDETSFDLLQRIGKGDVQALDYLLRRYTPLLRRWARGRLPQWARDVSDTQDLVQDTLIQAMKHLDGFRYEGPGALQAYLRHALMNRIRDELRRAHRRPAATELDEAIAERGASPLEQAIGHEALDAYETALSELRAEDREAIIARLELGQSYEEVAAILGKPTPNAARVAVQRAVIRLAEKMGPAHRLSAQSALPTAAPKPAVRHRNDLEGG
jgi:RNA polymerase sigma-70 factor, ECF subfamily